MPNEKVMVKVYENGDTEYLTPLPELEVNAYKSDIELGSNATYSQYADWFLKNLGVEAADKAQYARIKKIPRAMNAFRFIGDNKTQEDIRKGYEAYRLRNNIQD